MASDSADDILSFSSLAAAFVKVTTSIFEISAGESGEVSFPIILLVRTAVFPEPAAAETSMFFPSRFIASSWASVHFLSAICISCVFDSVYH